MIEIVSATRMSKKEFWGTSALGLSLKRMAQDKRLIWNITFENRYGLPKIYNTQINAGDSNDIVVFIHDDVWIDDVWTDEVQKEGDTFADRVIAGLERYDMIGVIGNIRRLPGQAGWCFLDTKLTWDADEYLSGACGFGPQPFGFLDSFGPHAACELLDGVFLAAKKGSLRDHDVYFDPRFDFHYYDMDLCRRARQQELTLGTWPIALTHQSGGGFDSRRWKDKYRTYIEKWGD